MQNEIRPCADRKVQHNETQTTETEAKRFLDMDMDRLRSDHALLIQAIESAPEEARQRAVSASARIKSTRQPDRPPARFHHTPDVDTIQAFVEFVEGVSSPTKLPIPKTDSKPTPGNPNQA